MPIDCDLVREILKPSPISLLINLGVEIDDIRNDREQYTLYGEFTSKYDEVGNKIYNPPYAQEEKESEILKRENMIKAIEIEGRANCISSQIDSEHY